MTPDSLLYDFLQAFTIIFVILDPLGNIPLFLALTEGMSDEQRAKTFDKASAIALLLLLVFAITGEKILSWLGISFESFMIAGGFLLLMISIDIFRGLPKEYEHGEDKSSVPLGTPLLAGPGAITATILSMRSWGYVVTIAAVFSAIACTWAILRSSEQIYRRLGRSGSNALSRVMGIIAAAIAVEYIAKGVIGLSTRLA